MSCYTAPEAQQLRDAAAIVADAQAKLKELQKRSTSETGFILHELVDHMEQALRTLGPELAAGH